MSLKSTTIALIILSACGAAASFIALIANIPLLQSLGIVLLLAILVAAVVMRRSINSLLRQQEDTHWIHTAVAEIVNESDMQHRFRLAVRRLRTLGWASVHIVLQNNEVVYSDPPTDTALTINWRHWLDKRFESHRRGIGYYFPTGKTTFIEGLQADNLLAIPLYNRVVNLSGLILLANATKTSRSENAVERILTAFVTHLQSIIENQLLFTDMQIMADELQQQIEELVMMQRVDQELSATLNFDSVMMLTMDWALRRTGANAGMLNMISRDGSALYPVATLGYPSDIIGQYNANNPLSISQGIVGRAIRESKTQVVGDVLNDPDYMPLLASTRSEVCVPMEIRGRVLGVLNLESDQPNTFDDAHVSFVERLARRAVVAMDNARLYREAEGRADEMAALYSAGRVISESIERNDVLTNSAQSLAAVLNVSSAILVDYRPERNELIVTKSYRLGTIRGRVEPLLPVGHKFDLSAMPNLLEILKSQHIFVAHNSDPDLQDDLRDFIDKVKAQSLMIVPMIVQSQLLGAAIIVESRRKNTFTQDEMLLAESIVSQVAAALRQAALFENVRELEKIKSEMIRMASHDIRNPLGNAMAYFELLMMQLAKSPNNQQTEYIEGFRHATETMVTLIDDLLSLERAESELQAAWKRFDLSQLVQDAVTSQKSNADLKGHTLTLKLDHEQNTDVQGSSTQLRQAITNLITNAIKYTPEGGRVDVSLLRQNDRLVFEVKDNGYGISKERQSRLFQRFYRAREPVTDHISGTGLGLSLVKTVIERHNGEVWVSSELGAGSTFGFWLPVADIQKLPEPTTADKQQK